MRVCVYIYIYIYIYIIPLLWINSTSEAFYPWYDHQLN